MVPHASTGLGPRPGPGFVRLIETRALDATDPRNIASYPSLFELLDQGFCVIEVKFDETGRARDYVFLEVNRAFEAHTGLVGAVGKSMRDLRADHEDEWFEIYGQVASTGRSARFERPARALDRWYKVCAMQVDEPDRHRVAVLFEDITEQKAAAAHVARLAAVMEQMAATDRHKDEFLVTLAHELRNPLAPLSNGLHIARRVAGDNAPLQHTIAMMERQLAQVVRLVDDLLDVGRINSGKVGLQRAALRLDNLIAASIEACQTQIDSHGHKLTIEGASADLAVEGDASRLTQVLSNLLSNAAKYTEPGGDIRVRVERDGAFAAIHVSDNGIGIPQDDLPNVFNIFSQAREHRSHAEGGLGIGLSLVQSLVRMHGGSVTAHSDGPGHGADFTVRLPLIS